MRIKKGIETNIEKCGLAMNLNHVSLISFGYMINSVNGSGLTNNRKTDGKLIKTGTR